MIAIFDTNAGFLQHTSSAGSHAEAIREAHKVLGVDIQGAIDALADGGKSDDFWRVMDVTPEQSAALDAWAMSGFCSSEYPDGLPTGRVYDTEEVIALLA